MIIQKNNDETLEKSSADVIYITLHDKKLFLKFATNLELKRCTAANLDCATNFKNTQSDTIRKTR